MKKEQKKSVDSLTGSDSPLDDSSQAQLTDLYLRDIRKYTPLSREDEVKAINAARKGDQKALNHLITANLRLLCAWLVNTRGVGCLFPISLPRAIWVLYALPKPMIPSAGTSLSLMQCGGFARPCSLLSIGRRIRLRFRSIK